MRLIFLSFIIVFALYSCNNDLNTIGQDLIHNGNSIEQATFTINTAGTIKVDSFVTSCGKYSSTTINTLIMGKYEDNYSGTTTAIPCFQVVPSYQPSIPQSYVLDSLTFNFSYAGNTWGDTAKLTLQSFDLFQLSEIPEIDYQDNYYIYSNREVHLGRYLSTVEFYPEKENIDKAYFKLPKSLGDSLFQKMQYNDSIFYPDGPSDIPFLNFIEYFKGLAIVPKSADCLFSIHALPDSLYLRFHYRVNETENHFDIQLGQREYQYNYFHNAPATRFDELKNNIQETVVPFEQASKIALAQGLSGYMIKLTLPNAPALRPYMTVIKAEIELPIEKFAFSPIPNPAGLYVYHTNDRNDIGEAVLNSSNTAVTGTYKQDLLNDNNMYVFDVTGYYNTLSQTPPNIGQDIQVLLTIPALTTSFDRVVMNELPRLKIYYANYNN